MFALMPGVGFAPGASLPHPLPLPEAVVEVGGYKAACTSAFHREGNVGETEDPSGV